ncbi:MAG: CatB-related O-acetyltransferase, partial [candidate division KSB1 bacterium]|nr:CatB-related O-acetyltransferase [candidate division KSB1 bacterium]
MRYARYQIGEYTYGFPLVYDWNEGSTLKIGKFCSIAKNVKIFLGGNHRSDWVTTFPFPEFFKDAQNVKDYTATKGDVIIGSDVWIGHGAIILSGVTIGDGAVIGAGSVVSKSVPPFAVAAGNPAKVTRMRFSDRQIEQLLQIRWWDWPTAKIVSFLPLLLSPNIDEFIS